MAGRRLDRNIRAHAPDENRAHAPDEDRGRRRTKRSRFRDVDDEDLRGLSPRDAARLRAFRES